VRISGIVRVPPLEAPLAKATLRVRVEDATRIDVPAALVKEFVVPEIPRGSGEVTPIPFDFECPPLEGKRRYALRVHLDVGATGEVTLGDYVSTQSYPLMPGGAGQSFDITLRPVG
jgi:hypothetical protein